MMSLKKLAAGSGYDYLTRQVATQDASLPAGGLSSYYTERGEAPGMWVGSGLEGLGIRPGEIVTEEQMQHLLGVGEHPLADPKTSPAHPTTAASAGSQPAPTRRTAMTVHRAASRPTEYLTLQEAAERYHVSVMTLRRRIHSGALPAVHSGRRLIRIPDSALE